MSFNAFNRSGAIAVMGMVTMGCGIQHHLDQPLAFPNVGCHGTSTVRFPVSQLKEGTVFKTNQAFFFVQKESLFIAEQYAKGIALSANRSGGSLDNQSFGEPIIIEVSLPTKGSQTVDCVRRSWMGGNPYVKEGTELQITKIIYLKVTEEDRREQAKSQNEGHMGV